MAAYNAGAAHLEGEPPKNGPRLTLAQVRKALLAFVGFLLTVIAAALAVGGVIPDVALPYINIFVMVAASYGVYRIRNAEAPPSLK